MDYVVAGFGIGAILALAGFALWELYGTVEQPGTSWLSRAAIGLMLGALVIWAITGVTLISTIDDSTGSQLVLLTTLVTVASIAAGTFWYWRADRAMVKPAAPAARAQREPALTVHDDVELDEWDSWPDRVEPQAEALATERDVQPAIFEPEVAVEPIAAAAAVEVVEEIVEPQAPMQVLDQEEAIPDEQPQIVAEPEETLPEREAPAAARVLPFRPRPETAALSPVEPEPEVAEAEDEQVALARSEEAGNEADEEPEEAPPASNGNTSRAAFESALLADVDATTVESDGRYQSPLLSDLVPDPDELEGVGLAKWRPDARLAPEEPTEVPKTRRTK